MDRLSSDLLGSDGGLEMGHSSPIGDPPAVNSLVAAAQNRTSIPDDLFALGEIDVMYDERDAALWSFMRPAGRPSFTPTLLADFASWQRLIGAHFGPERVPLNYLILGSRAPGVFCFGGDLTLFEGMIRDGNRDGLAAYGYRCVEILHRNMHALDIPMLTIGLVQGQALGGGFEALLSFDYIIAERGSTFGLPEVMFGLFPGMGAHAILTRKLGSAMADRVIMGNETYSAEAMYDLGIVHQLANPGEGVAAVKDFISKSGRRHAGLVGARRASRRAENITLAELRDIVDHWANAALLLREQDLKLMYRLAAAQARLRQAAA